MIEINKYLVAFKINLLPCLSIEGIEGIEGAQQACGMFRNLILLILKEEH